MMNSKVAVLLCTYNGETHLEEQLDSIENQAIPNIDVWVSDDGSTDKTLEILSGYQTSWRKGRFVIKQGPGKGFAANFLSLVCDDAIKANLFAYCDQDDIWERDKLTRAEKALSCFEGQASVYCSRTAVMDESGNINGEFSPLFKKPPSFNNALVQSLAGGNTMVFNQKTKHLLCQAGALEIISHDWWTYQLVTGVGGKVIYDSLPAVNYRQHSNNQVGINLGWAARMSRIKRLFEGRFEQWNEVNINALHQVRHLLSKDNQRTLEQFTHMRKANIIERLILFKKTRIYRQTFSDNIALFGATLLKKL